MIETSTSVQPTNESVASEQPPPRNLNIVFERKWHPSPTYLSTVVVYVVFAITFLAVSVLLFHANGEITELRLNQYNKITEAACNNITCNYSLTIFQTIHPPIQFLYELQGFYQNHRRYIQSKNNHQLSGTSYSYAGNSISKQEAERSCSPIVLNKDIHRLYSWDGQLLDPNAVASPCGLIAKSIFNDTYRIIDSTGQVVKIDETNIAWSGDSGRKYRRTPNSSTEQWLDPENEHFIVWMRTAGLTNFRKLWGRINQKLSPGVYIIEVVNNYNITQYLADKSVVLTTTNWVGGKNTLLPTVFLVLFIACLVVGGFFMYKRRKIETEALQRQD